DLARLEREYPAAGDRDLLASLRVAALPGAFFVDHEVAEPGELDLLTVLELALDDLEQRLDDLGRLLLGEPDALVDALDDVSLRDRHDRASAPQLEGEALAQVLAQPPVECLDLVVGEGAVRRPIRDRVCEALAARGDRGSPVTVEQPRALDTRIAKR